MKFLTSCQLRQINNVSWNHRLGYGLVYTSTINYFYVEIIISLLFCVFVYYFMCVFILGEWITPTVVGDRPPPIDEFTLTSITNNTAVLFGGTTTNYHNNKVYFINFTKTSVVS